jgi:zinc protease
MSARWTARVAMALLCASCGTVRTRAELPQPAPVEQNVARSPAPPAESERAWSAPTIEQLALSNGIPLYFSSHSADQIAIAYCNHRAGEDDLGAPAGLASITSAMITDGSEAHRGRALQLAFAQRGTTLVDHTSRAGTCFSVRASRAELDEVAALLAEAVRSPAFDEGDFVARRTAQMDERAGNVLSRAPLARLLAHDLVFGSAHPYGRPETGLGPEIRARTLAEVRAYHRARYTTANSALVVAGGEREAVRAALDRAFGAWQTADVPALAPRQTPTIAPRRAARLHIIDTHSGSQSHILVAWPGPARHDGDWPALVVLERVLGGMFSSRLNLALREDEGYAYGAHTSLSLSRFGGLIMARTNVETSVTAQGLRRLLAEVSLLRDHEISDEELATALALERAEHQSGFETPGSALIELTQLHFYGLALDYPTRLDAAIRAITAREVKIAARRWLSQSEALIVVAGPRREIEAPLQELRLSEIEHWNFQR